MNGKLTIFIDRLQQGKEERLKATLPPDCMELDDPDLQFRAPIEVSLRAYLADNQLVLHLNIETEINLRCGICNNLTTKAFHLPSLTEVVPIASIKGNVYDCCPLLREVILLEVPHYVECRGNCLQRAKIAHYLTGKHPDCPPPKEEVQFPFSDLTPD